MDTTKTTNDDQIVSLLNELIPLLAESMSREEIKKEIDAQYLPFVEQMATAFHNERERLVEHVEKALKNMPPKELHIKEPGKPTKKIKGPMHRNFETLLLVLTAADASGVANVNVWLTGAPGTGKTTAARMAADALGKKFYSNGSVATKYELMGFIDAGGKLHRTAFRDAWEKGGVFLFDEIDGSDPKAVLAFNAGLANGFMAFPDGMIPRHKDCILIAAANTYGHGATSELVGRTKLDAASLDRFVMLEWELDENLERLMVPTQPKWVEYVQTVRATAKAKQLKVLITPRASVYGAQLLNAGLPWDQVCKMVLKKGMTDDQWEMIR